MALCSIWAINSPHKNRITINPCEKIIAGLWIIIRAANETLAQWQATQREGFRTPHNDDPDVSKKFVTLTREALERFKTLVTQRENERIRRVNHESGSGRIARTFARLDGTPSMRELKAAADQQAKQYGDFLNTAEGIGLDRGTVEQRARAELGLRTGRVSPERPTVSTLPRYLSNATGNNGGLSTRNEANPATAPSALPPIYQSRQTGSGIESMYASNISHPESQHLQNSPGSRHSSQTAAGRRLTELSGSQGGNSNGVSQRR